LGTRLVRIILLLVCGCAPPAKKPHAAEPHHQRTVRINRGGVELSNAKKDKLFRNFEDWLATRRRRDPVESPLANVVQTPDAE
jgi:hypothetical protein